MSWSVFASGRPGEVKESIAKQFSAFSTMGEPELSIRDAAADLIAQAIDGNTTDRPIRVLAHGSQSASWDGAKYGAPFANQLSIIVEPIRDFAEAQTAPASAEAAA
jgi:hypothetical protein